MTDKGLILYKSTYGSAQKYAQWLADATGFPCLEAQKASAQALQNARTVILCGGVYASGIAGAPVLKKNAGALQGKQVLVLAVGASPYDEKAVEELRACNLPGDLAKAQLFYARGAWDESRMSFIHRTMCSMLQKAVAKKDPATLEPWAVALLEARGHSCDWTNQEYLRPLLGALGR